MGQTLLEREAVLEETLDWEVGLHELHCGTLSRRVSAAVSLA